MSLKYHYMELIWQGPLIQSRISAFKLDVPITQIPISGQNVPLV